MGGSHREHRTTSIRARRTRTGIAYAGLAMGMPLALLAAQQGAAMGADAVPIACATAGKVFIVDGTNDDPNNLHTRGVAARYPGYEVEHVAYPATVWPLGADSYAASSAAGQQALRTGVVDYRARPGCTESPVVIVGYSQGAAIAGDELYSIAHDPQSPIQTTDALGRPIVSGELYSDPRRTGDTRGRGIELSLVGVIPGLIMRGARGPGGYGDVPVLDVCLDGDPICDLPDPLHDPIGAADGLLGFFTKHFDYDRYMADPGSAGGGASPTGTVIVARPMAFAMVLADVGVHAFDTVRSIYIPVPYPDLATVQPIVAFLQRLGPQIPDLGHGATLPDLYTIRDALQDNPVARARLVTDLASIGRYPATFIADWTAAIDAALNRGVLPPSARTSVVATAADAPTVSAAPAPIPTGSVPSRPTVSRPWSTLIGEVARRLQPPAPTRTVPTGPSTVAPGPASTEPSTTPTAATTPADSAPTVDPPPSGSSNADPAAADALAS